MHVRYDTRTHSPFIPVVLGSHTEYRFLHGHPNAGAFLMSDGKQFSQTAKNGTPASAAMSLEALPDVPRWNCDSWCAYEEPPYDAIYPFLSSILRSHSASAKMLHHFLNEPRSSRAQCPYMNTLRDREMVQFFRVLAAHPEDMGLVPRTHAEWLLTTWNSSSWHSNPLVSTGTSHGRCTQRHRKYT